MMEKSCISGLWMHNPASVAGLVPEFETFVLEPPCFIFETFWKFICCDLCSCLYMKGFWEIGTRF